MFDATKNKYRDIQFSQYDTEDTSNSAIAARYGVGGIPHMVFLDASGNVLYSGAGAPRDQAAFEDMIKPFR